MRTPLAWTRRNRGAELAVDWPLGARSPVWHRHHTVRRPGAVVPRSTTAPATTPGLAAASAPASSGTTAAAWHGRIRHRHRRPPPSAQSQLGVVGPGPDFSISEAMDQRHRRVAVVRQPLQGVDHRGEPGQLDLVPLHRVGDPECQPRQECEPQMNSVREYRMPLMIGGGGGGRRPFDRVALVAP